MADVKVLGDWLARFGHVDDITYSTRWGPGPCGPDQASWTFDVDPSTDMPHLRLGRAVDLRGDNGTRMFGGTIIEPQRGTPWTVGAAGWAQLAGNFSAKDGSGNPTTNPRTAVTAAIARGLPWTNPNAFPDTSIGDAPIIPAPLDVLLDNWAVTAGLRWGTDAYGVAWTAADPTTPTLFLDAEDLDLGVAPDGMYTTVNATYVASVDPSTGDPATYDNEEVTDPAALDYHGSPREYEMDLTPLGLMSGATAAGYAAQQLATLTVPQWLSSVVTTGERLKAAGGHDADLPTVEAGMMVHLYNVPYSLGGLRGELGTNVVLGQASWSEKEPTQITIAPVNLAVRNLADALAEAAEAAKAANQTTKRFARPA